MPRKRTPSPLGGHLASITSAAENAFVYSLVSPDPTLWVLEGATGNGIGPWLGAFQPPGSPEPGGGYQWVDGEPFVYTNWAPWEPSNGVGSPGNAGLGIEDRIHFFGSGGLIGSGWNDYPAAPAPPQILPVSYIVETPPFEELLMMLEATEELSDAQLVGFGSVHYEDLGAGPFTEIERRIPSSFLEKAPNGVGLYGTTGAGDLVLALAESVVGSVAFESLFPGRSPEAVLANPDSFFGDSSVRSLVALPWGSEPTPFRLFAFGDEPGRLVGDGTFSPIPEPTTIALLGLGLLGVAHLGRRRQHRN
jgi:hypothetical protein